ncbi:diaminopimelate epimerase [Lichenibacterium dinghuense]|uniref:diaminopimelate epimerase n=1 Tax=Lichenibacterium dinghuense TaxID=2895977 RepID=UPI001EFF7A3D|nr:diaminopimelate epimerase [Lichenibacterium sp. 6Y81]
MLRYAKMNGAGNSILVVDERGAPPALTGDTARALCRGPLAFDQLMALSDGPDEGAIAVRIFNTDGSRAGACGNGSRCVAWFVAETGGGDAVVLDVDGTRVSCRRDGPLRFTVDMGPPRFGWRDIPLREAADTLNLDLGDALQDAGLERPAAVSMGNPHAVFFVPDAEAIDLAAVGPRFEHHPMFPDRANVSFAEVRGPGEIRLRVWERGAGATLACGSAACATVAAAALRGLTGRRARVLLPGGELAIDWSAGGPVLMTGPVELEHRGRLDPATGGTAPW